MILGTFLIIRGALPLSTTGSNMVVPLIMETQKILPFYGEGNKIVIYEFLSQYTYTHSLTPTHTEWRKKVHVEMKWVDLLTVTVAYGRA